MTVMPSVRSSSAVPPVERISTPSWSSARAKAATPVLSETLMSARLIAAIVSFAGPAAVRGRSVELVLLEFLAQRVAVDSKKLRRATLVALDVAHHRFEQRS